MAISPNKLLIFGFGNTMAGDDGVAARVLRTLSDAGLPSPCVELRLIGAPGPELIDSLTDPETEVWFVDAAVAEGREPGAVLDETVEPGAAPGLETAGRLVTSHGFSVAELIKLADALGRRRARLRLWGIVGQNFSPGENLSGPVAKSADRLAADMIKLLLDRKAKS